MTSNVSRQDLLGLQTQIHRNATSGTKSRPEMRRETGNTSSHRTTDQQVWTQFPVRGQVPSRTSLPLSFYEQWHPVRLPTMSTNLLSSSKLKDFVILGHSQDLICRVHTHRQTDLNWNSELKVLLSPVRSTPSHLWVQVTETWWRAHRDSSNILKTS